MNELIIGLSETKRKEFVEKKIERLLKKPDNGKKITVIVPEQYTFETERRFLELFGEKALRRISVVSFKRLANLIFADMGALRHEFIGDGGKNAVILKAVAEVAPLLKYYPESVRSYPFISLVSGAITEMEISGLSPEELMRAAETENNDKLHDISLFVSAYRALLEEGSFEADNRLGVLAKELQNTSLFRDADIICDKFSVFLFSETEVLLALAKTGANVCVSFPAPSLNEPKYSLFSVISKNAAAFRAKAQKSGLEFEMTVLEGNDDKPADLLAVKEHLYGEKTAECPPMNISIYKATDIIDEADFAAAKIVSLVRDKGYKYSDFTIIMRDSDVYAPVLEPAFEKYGIPLFCHRRVPLRIKPLCSLVDALFSVICDGYRREYVLAFLKTGLTEPDDDDVAAFERYTEKWRISYGAFLSDFTLPADDGKAESLERINKTRQYVVSKTESFRDAANGGTIKTIAEALYGFFVSISLKSALDKAGEEYAAFGEDALFSEQKQIYDLIINALDELVSVAKNDIVSFDEFRELLFAVIEENDIGIIPTAVNEVTAGGIDSVPLNMPKVAFVFGLSDGKFPKTDSGFSLFDDNDRALLEKYDIILGKTEEEKLIHEQYLAYKALTASTEKLYLSYASSSSAQTRPSSAIAEIMRIFPSVRVIQPLSQNVPEVIAERIQNLPSAFDVYTRFGSPKLKNYIETTEYGRFLHHTESTDLEKETAEKLFGKNMRLSASRVAKYYECGFSYFCEYGLKLKKKRDNILGALETGNYMHFILEHALAEGLGTNEEIRDIAEKYSSEYLISLFGSAAPPAGFMTYYRRLVQKAARLLVMFRDELEQSEFVPVDFEVKIGFDGKVKPVEIPVEGGSVCLVGVADRVDIFEKDGRKFIRVVDYKSGAKTFDLQYVYYGLDVQMLMYLYALGENGKDIYGHTEPAGCMYVNANPKIVALKKDGGYADAEAELRKKHPRSGIFLNDTSVLNAMENGLGGKYIPVKTGQAKAPLATEEQFGKLFLHIKNLLKNMASSLLNGNTSKNPIKTKKKDGCEYCVYNSFCFYGGQGRGMEKIGTDNIFEKIDSEKP
ncbi:MAG: PD-(D/E)XK nuclease family protein [Clostridia bacterium]|nr:PD-(D/E)XK nuclease family protein [Clostridia bacterium]